MKKLCPSCNKIIEWKKILISADNDHGIYKCSKCNLKSIIPIPKNEVTQGLYESITHEYDSAKAAMAATSVEYYKKIFDKYLTNIKNDWELLDIGAGLGYYTNAFGKLGIQATYNDGDYISSNFAMNHQHHIKDFQCMNAEEHLTSYESGYDIIFCRHFIEHTFSPQNIIKLMLKCLNKNGIIILETDNNASSEVLVHPDAGMYWRNVYMEDYLQNDINKLLKLKITAISKRNTHWWAFNQKNIKPLIKNSGGKVLLNRNYYLGDTYLWPNVNNYKSFPHDKLKEHKTIKEYLKYIKKSPGAGMLLVFTHR